MEPTEDRFERLERKLKEMRKVMRQKPSGSARDVFLRDVEAQADPGPVVCPAQSC